MHGWSPHRRFQTAPALEGVLVEVNVTPMVPPTRARGCRATFDVRPRRAMWRCDGPWTGVCGTTCLSNAWSHTMCFLDLAGDVGWKDGDPQRSAK